MFMLDEMTWRNASKFAIFLEYKNPSIIIISFFIFSPDKCPGLYRHRPGHALGKNKVERNEKQ